ncbi:phage tail protein, partial [Laribacter hongkongensis]|uniref:phage tail protein n=1 Tax=Laribacter hongkongensis TaxID=168471 RepID=UPI001EFCA3F9
DQLDRPGLLNHPAMSRDFLWGKGMTKPAKLPVTGQVTGKAVVEKINEVIDQSLGIDETAADSARLGGQLPGYYAAALDAVPPGFVGSFAMASAPAGWLKANGAVVSRAAYSRLFSVIGTTFGTGDGSTTFNLPDLRGEFVRGWDDRRGVDNGRVFGSTQADALQGHGHELLYPYTGANGGDLGAAVQTSVAAQVLRNRATAITDLASFGAARTSSETRGRNVALLACIKY